MILFSSLNQVTVKVIYFFIINIILIKTSFALTDEQFNRVNSLIEQQNIEKSFELLKTFQSNEEELSSRSLLLFGKIYLELGQPLKAINYFESVYYSSIELNDYAYVGMANSEFMLGNLSKSKAFALKALNINPNLTDAIIILAQILADENLIEKSDKLFLSTLDSSPSSSYAGRKFVETLLRRNQIDKAETILKQTIINNSIDAPSLELFSDIYWLRGELKTAIKFKQQAKEKYLEVGNKIKARKINDWLAFQVNTNKTISEIYTQELISKKVVGNLAIINSDKVEPNKQLYQNKQKTNVTDRIAFEPKITPEEIIIDNSKPVFTGSGAIINSGKWILTNKHVVNNLNYIIVRNGLGEIRNVKEIRVAEDDDLAILILSKPYSSDYSLSINDFKKGKTGSSIYVIGYPIASLFGSFHPSITQGIISNPLGFDENNNEFQITAKINPGNSGGPIFNKFGKIVGIVTGKLDSQKILKNEGFYPEDINFGIQPDAILSFLNVNNDDRIKLLSDISYDYEYNIEDLYKYMRSAIVFIVAQR